MMENNITYIIATVDVWSGTLAPLGDILERAIISPSLEGNYQSSICSHIDRKFTVIRRRPIWMSLRKNEDLSVLWCVSGEVWFDILEALIRQMCSYGYSVHAMMGCLYSNGSVANCLKHARGEVFINFSSKTNMAGKDSSPTSVRLVTALLYKVLSGTA